MRTLLVLSLSFCSGICAISAYVSADTADEIAPCATSNVGGTIKDDMAKKDQKSLQGTWGAVSAEFDKGRPSSRELMAIRLVFDGAMLRIVDGKDVLKTTYILDPAKKPSAIDLKSTGGNTKGRTYLGIYELKGDTLKICFSEHEQDRPTEFAAEGKPGIRTYFMLERQKQEDKDPELQAALPKLTIHRVDAPAPLPADDAENKAIEAVTRLDGTVKRDEKAPGKPVVHVELANTKVTDADLKLVASFKSLQYLNLGFTAVTDEEMKELAGLKSLQCLVLYQTKVTDAGLKHIAGLVNLKGLADLEELYLDGTQVTDAGLDNLKTLTRLHSLSIRLTKTTDEGVKSLRQSLPKLKVIR